MKKTFTLLTLLTILIISAGNVNAQLKYFRTIGSGNWTSYSIWEVSTSGVAGPYTAAASGTTGGTNYPDKTTNVIIQSGNTVTLTGTATVGDLTINNGGILQSDGTARSLRPYASAGTTTPSTITNNGTLGGPTTGPDAIVLEAYNDAASYGYTLTGTGTTRINRIRMVGSSNNPTKTLAVVIDQNITLTQTSNYALTAIYNPGTSDNYSITINSGKTVTISSATGYVNNNSQASSLIAGTSSYTYNINGALDNSANVGTTGISTFGPAGAGNSIALNISGTYKTGSLTTTSNSGNTGNLLLVIKNGGVLDATTGTLTYEPPYLFATEGTGIMLRTVAVSNVAFPVSTAGSNNTAIINNAGTTDNYSVNVKTAIDVTPPTTNVVNRQWTISEQVAGGSSAIVSLSWQTADQAIGFNPATAVAIYRYNGSSWQTYAATVSGTGTASDPYVATTTAPVTAFSPFIVGNALSVLPVTITDIKAFTKNSGVQVEWLTSSEVNVEKYIVERSSDGRTFNEQTTIKANGNSNYTWFDANPSNGANLYRVRSVDADGSSRLSTIVLVNLSLKNSELSISNPVKGNLLNLRLNGVNQGEYNLYLYNNQAQRVYSSVVAVTGASYSQGISLPALPKGIYTVQVIKGMTILTKKIIIE
jgi:hypothetical protein